MFHRPAPLVLRGLVLSALLLTPSVLAQDATSLFHEAYYLEHEGGDPARALELYNQVEASAGVEHALRQRAAAHAAGLREELAASDLAALVPADILAFAQVAGPGDQLASLLDQMGLLGEAGRVPSSGVAVSPLLIEHLVGLRSLGVAVTGFQPGEEPSGVAILHPGGDKGLRGLFDTLLPAGGEPVDAVGGFPAWNVENEVFVCRTARLVIVSRELENIELVVDRLNGHVVASLADDVRYTRSFQPGADTLLSFYVNAQPLVPMLRAAILQEAQGDPGAMLALNMLDLGSLECLTGRLGVDEHGVGLDLALDLAEGHRNLVFNLMRRPTVGVETLALVPDGAAFFLATAFNPEASVAEIPRDAKGQPIVSALDLGRELFGNMVDAAVYASPEDTSTGLPDVALVVRVHDAERSSALWQLVLDTAAQAAGGASLGSEQADGIELHGYSVNGIPLFMAGLGDRVVLSPNRDSVLRAVAGSGPGAGADPVFARALDVLERSPTLLVGAAPGRLGEMGLPWAPKDVARQVEPFLDMLGETSVTLAGMHSDTRLGLRLRIDDLPRVGGMVSGLVAAQRRGWSSGVADRRGAVQQARMDHEQTIAAVRAAAKAPPTPAPKPHDALAALDPEELGARLVDAAREGDVDGAAHLGEVLVAKSSDAKQLNNLAWSLLTEERFDGRHDALARVLALRSNELAEHGNWYYLDTLALAEFRAGDVERAVELQQAAIGKAQADGHHPELEESLRRYRSALDNDPIVQANPSEAR